MCADLVICVLESSTNLLSLGIGAIGKHINNGLFICAWGGEEEEEEEGKRKDGRREILREERRT